MHYRRAGTDAQESPRMDFSRSTGILAGLQPVLIPYLVPIWNFNNDLTLGMPLFSISMSLDWTDLGRPSKEENGVG